MDGAEPVIGWMERAGAWCGSVAAGLGFVLALGAAPLRAEPALWVLHDADSTVYLFGTVHVLRPDTDWLTPRVYDAFEGADRLWLETDTAPGFGIALPLLRYGIDWKTALASRLGPEDTARLSAIVTAAGMAPSTFRHMRPWLVALTLASLPMTGQGFDAAAGADAMFEQLAGGLKKPIRRLETITQQLRIFADLPPDEEMAMLREAIDVLWAAREGKHDKGADIGDLVDAWMAGDVDRLGAIVRDDGMAASAPLYEALFVRRNREWVKEIKAIMDGAGTDFIAVGAGHLAGDDSVIAGLAALGIVAERL
ncbi:TraB/GumN family protein [Zavarzinia sp.]|uniref:TraB/GumN family protein n=1 Tax=Zavarzinia sp. TaxID=2027920 RepID=UPI003BB4BF5C